MGAVTFTQYADPLTLGGNARLLRGNVTMSASYATGGDTIDWPGDLSVPEGGVMLGGVSGGRALEYDGANQKIKAYQDNAAAAAAALGEVANATNLSTLTCECWVLSTT